MNEKFVIYAVICLLGGALFGTEVFVIYLAWRVALLEHACLP